MLIIQFLLLGMTAALNNGTKNFFSKWNLQADHVMLICNFSSNIYEIESQNFVFLFSFFSVSSRFINNFSSYLWKMKFSSIDSFLQDRFTEVFKAQLFFWIVFVLKSCSRLQIRKWHNFFIISRRKRIIRCTYFISI